MVQAERSLVDQGRRHVVTMTLAVVRPGSDRDPDAKADVTAALALVEHLGVVCRAHEWVQCWEPPVT